MLIKMQSQAQHDGRDWRGAKRYRRAVMERVGPRGTPESP